MKATREEDRLAKWLAVVERENQLLRAGPAPDAGVVGCGNSGCVVAPPQGMAPVGRCRCDEQVLRQMVSWQEREIARLRASLAECAEVVHRGDRAAVRTQIEDVRRLVDDGDLIEAERATDVVAQILGENHREVLALRTAIRVERP